jgi:cytidylate kinase
VPAPAWARRLVIFRCRGTLPAVIGVRGARHDNLGDVDADVPLWRTVERLRAADKARTAYVRRLYRCDPADPSLYHLVIDSTAIPLDTVTELILTASRAHEAPVPEQGETHSARW